MPFQNSLNKYKYVGRQEITDTEIATKLFRRDGRIRFEIINHVCCPSARYLSCRQESGRVDLKSKKTKHVQEIALNPRTLITLSSADEDTFDQLTKLRGAACRKKAVTTNPYQMFPADRQHPRQPGVVALRYFYLEHVHKPTNHVILLHCVEPLYEIGALLNRGSAAHSGVEGSRERGGR
ncbi:hypothetical protein NP493_46g04021 [Ridgeia piscesae]|uniref:Uncharacterized protein n=1 Tax=Ridgeia piscesae TaxID=27915 RepID=A0AAD9PBR6_RIDPI|nr:hypothetical protein NP493_46g04021 [Ridgeia piscesae]